MYKLDNSQLNQLDLYIYKNFFDDHELAEEVRNLFLSVEDQPDYKCRYRYHNNDANMILRWIVRECEYGELEIALEYDVTWKDKEFKGSISWEELIDTEELDKELAYTYRKEVMESVELEYYEKYGEAY